MVLELPDNIDRYYVMQFMDAYTNVFADPGTRTNGSGKSYCITGPNAEIYNCPESMEHI